MSETSNVSLKYYVYILLSLVDNGLYIGYSTDLKRRLVEHSKGQVRSTKLRIPFKLIYYEYFITASPKPRPLRARDEGEERLHTSKDDNREADVNLQLRKPRTVSPRKFINSKDAKAREKFLKSGFGRTQLKQILKNTFSDSRS